MTYQYGYKISATNTVLGDSGTLSVTLGSTALTGSGTTFTNYSAGDVFISGGNYYIIGSITDNTHIVLQAGAPAALAGASYSAIVPLNIESFISAPHSYFRPYVDLVDLGDGTKRGLGRPVAEWRWGFVTRAQRDALRAYCTGASATVIIRTRGNDTADAYKTYIATLVWPDETDKQAGRRINFTVAFSNLREA